MEFAAVRLQPFLELAIEAVDYSFLRPTGAGDPALGLSIAPGALLRGDPSLPPGLAGALAGPFDDLEDVAVAGIDAYRIFLSDAWWYFWGSNTHLYVTIGSEESAARALEAIIAGAPTPYLWQAGDCLWFGTGADTAMPYAPFGTANLVDCRGPHTHEVFAADTTSYDADDAYPGEAFAVEVERTCGIAFRDYIGLDWSESRIGAIRYLPDRAEWEEGDRYLACVAELTAPTGGASVIEGTLAGIGEASRIVRAPGDCYVDALNADPVDCRFTHTTQFIGYVEDPRPAETDYPGIDDLFDRLEPACAALIEEFAPTTSADGATIMPYLIPPSVVEWEDGDRTGGCFAFAAGADGRELEIAGSFDGDWSIVRFSEDDVTARTVPRTSYSVLRLLTIRST